MGNRNDLVALSQQMTETGRTLTRYGSNLDKVMAFLRDPRSKEAVQEFLAINGLREGINFYSGIGDQGRPFLYHGHAKGAIMRNASFDGSIFCACKGYLNLQYSTEIITTDGEIVRYLYSHPCGVIIVKDEGIWIDHEKQVPWLDSENEDLDEYRKRVRLLIASGPNIGVLQNLWVSYDGTIGLICSTLGMEIMESRKTQRNHVYLFRAGGTEGLSFIEEYSPFEHIPWLEEFGTLYRVERHPKGSMVITMSEEKRVGNNHHRLFHSWEEGKEHPIAGFGGVSQMSSLGLITTFQKVILIDGQEAYRTYWSEIKICQAGFITREGDRLVLNGKRVIYCGDFVDWDICPGVSAVVVQKRAEKCYELWYVEY